MYQLHIANKNYSSWSLRPWLVMKEMDIPFEEVFHPFGDTENWDRYGQINPSRLVPCLVSGENTVWDSLSIVEFLAEHHEGVWPSADVAKHWARSASCEMHSGFSTLRNICSMNCGVRVKLSHVTPSLQKDLSRIEAIWLEGLRRFGGEFLAGEKFTAVDAFYAPVAFRVQTFGISLSPKAMEYVSKLLSLDSMQLWYEEALQEPHRDLDHESDVSSYGEITDDFRKVT
ncbi:MAG: hypothetical protein RL336_364 [Pseudomonadota bacterium]